MREDKRGAIPETTPSILDRIGIEPTRYLEHIQGKAKTEQQTVIGHFESKCRNQDEPTKEETSHDTLLRNRLTLNQ
jgi:hypothetical protein